jgi:hypothetical protein
VVAGDRGVIRVSVEIQSGAARFRVVVWAESIDRAVRLVGARYPECEARVLFSIEPEAFFAAERALGVKKIVVEASEEALR